MHIQQDQDVLGLIDVQPTFTPGGELPVQEARAVVPATRDRHPPGHFSSASAHGGREPFGVVDLHYGPLPDATASIEAARPRLFDRGVRFVFRDELR